jgi:hypothetical protein
MKTQITQNCVIVTGNVQEISVLAAAAARDADYENAYDGHGAVTLKWEGGLHVSLPIHKIEHSDGKLEIHFRGSFSAPPDSWRVGVADHFLISDAGLEYVEYSNLVNYLPPKEWEAVLKTTAWSSEAAGGGNFFRKKYSWWEYRSHTGVSRKGNGEVPADFPEDFVWE